MLKTSAATVAGATLLGTNAFSMDKEHTGEKGKARAKKKVLVIGAHPDDPESCAGGTILKMLDHGFDVKVIYFTRGERGIANVSLQESARVRMAECEQACKVLGVPYRFMTQIDGESEITAERYLEMQEIIKAEQPDMVLTHWPIDSHRDHVNCSVLVTDTWRRVEKKFDIFYFEAMTGLQSKTFLPTDLVDISKFHDKKVEALYCHTSQDCPDWYPAYHLKMEEFYGLRLARKYAEAFVRFDQNPTLKAIMEY